MQIRRPVAIGLMVALFLVSFFLRAYRPVSRPDQWLIRAEEFYQALDEGDWNATYMTAHPGVTTMAVAGLALRLYDGAVGTPTEALFQWAIPPFATELGTRMSVAALGLAVALALLIVAITLVLRKLGGWTLALAAGGLLAFDPFLLQQSRAVHVDASVSLFMLLSGLLLILGAQNQKRFYVILSGFAGGLALLTKTPSLFLIPFTGLTLFAHLAVRLRRSWADVQPGERSRWLLRETWTGLLLPGLLWGVAAVALFALWPAVWGDPVGIVGRMTNWSNYHRITPHQRRFFLGQVYFRDNVGNLFYPVALAFAGTFLTLTLAILTLSHYTLWRKQIKPPVRPLTFWLMAAYVVAFVIQMTLGSKKADRYILPAHVGLIVVAAVGLSAITTLLAQSLSTERQRHANTLRATIVGLVVALQAAVALPFMPDYGVHHNYLLGGNPVAVRIVDFMGQNEGMLPVAAFLAEQPDPETLSVGVARPYHLSISQYFSGETTLGMNGRNDYHLFNMTAMQRDHSPQLWQDAFRAYQGGPSQVIVIYDRVVYAWLYATRPDADFQQIVVRRGGRGFVWLAWAWTGFLAAGLALGLRSSLRSGRSPAT